MTSPRIVFAALLGLGWSLLSCTSSHVMDASWPRLRAAPVGTRADDLTFEFSPCDAEDRGEPDVSRIFVTRQPDGAVYCSLAMAKGGRPFMGPWRYGSTPPGLAGTCRPLDTPGRYEIEFRGSGLGRLEFEVDSSHKITMRNDGC